MTTKKEILTQLEGNKDWLSKANNHKVRMTCKNKKDLEDHQKVYKKELDEEMYERIEWRTEK